MSSKRKYYKNDDPAQYRYFNYKIWQMLTSQEQSMWQPLDDQGWPGEKKFIQYRDEKKFRFFSQKTWDTTPPEEQDLWKSADDSDWPVVEKLSREEKKLSDEVARKQHNENTAKTSTDNLRLKVGAKIDMLGSTGELLRWGPRSYLIRYWKKNTPDQVKYGIMPRVIEDSSYGARDILKENQGYAPYDTFESAEKAYEHANQ